LSTICVKYYALMKKALELDELLDDLSSEYDMLMDCGVDHDFINCSIDELLETFPKFLSNTTILDNSQRINNYNHEKIYNATTMTHDQLLVEISKDTNLGRLLNMVREIPDYYDDQVKECVLQSNYFDSIKKHRYNKNLYINNYNSINYFNFSKLLTTDETVAIDHPKIVSLDRYSYFHIYFFYSLINYIFKKRSNLRDNLVSNIKCLSLPSLTTGISGTGDYSEMIIDEILTHQFSFVDVNTSFKNRIYQDADILASISELDDLFDTYVTANASTLKYNIVDTFFDIFNHRISFDIVDLNYDKTRYFDIEEINRIAYNLFPQSEIDNFMNLYVPNINIESGTLSDFENDIYTFHNKSLNSSQSIRNYLYILCLYRNNLQKFINLIDLAAVDYVQNNINVDDVYYFNNFKHMNELCTQWLSSIRYVAFNDILLTNSAINSPSKQKDNFVDKNSNNNILKFAQIYEYRYMVELFVNTSNFKHQIVTIHNKVFNYLRSKGLISPDTDWCSCVRPTEVYLFFVLNKRLENLSITNLQSYVEDQIDISRYLPFTHMSVDITNISKSNPCEIKINNTSMLKTGDVIKIIDVVDMTQLNNRKYTITVKDTTTIELDEVDSSSYSSWTSGGKVIYNELDVPAEFSSFVRDFNSVHSYYFFEFYRTFITSLVCQTFSKVIHDNYKLSTQIAVDITQISKSNPCEITVSDGSMLRTNYVVRIIGVTGMTQLNNKKYRITVSGTNKIQLNGVDSSSYSD